MGKRKIVTTMCVIALFVSLFTHGMIILGPIVKIAGAADITTWSDTNSTLNVTSNSEVPSINFYDFQITSTNASQLDTDIDVVEAYQFVLNATDLQGWDDIDYINITAWYDNGSETNYYNDSVGGNLNMFLQYENLTGTANWNMLWPDDEVTFSSANCTDTVISSTTHNLTFVFMPLYQVRYSEAATGLHSWNFNITIHDNSTDNITQSDEYGVFMYTRITQTTENPSVTGNPGDNDLALSPSTNVTTRCNANYSLSVNLPNLTDGSGHYILNSSVAAQGGDLAKDWFDGANAQYIYGGVATYRDHLINTYEDTNAVSYWINISLGQYPGNYTSTVTYTIVGQT